MKNTTTINQRPPVPQTKKYDLVAEVKLTEKQETYLRKKFDKYAKVLQWTGADSTYYIHANSRILKHTDTCCLFNLLAIEYVVDNTIKIW